MGFQELLDSIGKAPVDNAPAPEVRTFTAGAPVGWSKDLDRVCLLPRRNLDLSDRTPAQVWTERLRKPAAPCDCVAKWGFCITELNPVQGHLLDEAARTGGLLGPVGVGQGKTGADILLAMAVPNVKRAVLMVPPSLRNQFLTRDYPQWSAHFRTPNLAGGDKFTPGRPVLHLVAYSELSQPKNSDLLSRIAGTEGIDLIIADEAHCLKDTKSARTKRFLRALKTLGSCRFVALSGTLTTRSIKDYAHLSQHALGNGSPLPLHYPTVDEWSAALDPSPCPSPAGMLRRFCDPTDSLHDGFRKRLVQTPGVVATRENLLGTSLVINDRSKIKVPDALRELILKVEETAARPDGEEAEDALTVSAWVRQLVCGFYYVWTFPRKEAPELIDRWFSARKAWNKAVRERLKTSREGMDSPHLLAKAAIRFNDGYRFAGITYMPHTKNGPLPTWECPAFQEWRDVAHSVKPQTEAVWVNDYLARDAAEWASKAPGVVWYEHTTFGEKVAQLAGLTRYGGGEEASRAIQADDGKRSIVASVKAHGTGKNLQRAFSRNLFANPLANGALMEQAIGRTHRFGQPADEVSVTVYRHCDQAKAAFDKALTEARYIQATTQQIQKLCLATYDFGG